jgi:hypothetical protein
MACFALILLKRPANPGGTQSDKNAISHANDRD